MTKLVRTRFRELGLIALVLLGGGAMLAYTLSRQDAFKAPAWFPGAQDRYAVDAVFSSANGIVPGKGQPVTVAGVQVGDVGEVRLEDGRAVITLDLERRHAPVHADATVLLRPRTNLKDYTVALDPGTPGAAALPDGGRIPVGQTNPDVAFDEVLSALDLDTRRYLQILLASTGMALRDPPSAEATADGPAASPRAVSDLRAALRQIEPLAAQTRAVTTGLSERRRNLRRFTTRLRKVSESIGGANADLTGLIRAADATFAATAAADGSLRSTLDELPPALRQTRSALDATARLADQLGPATASLVPFAEELAPALRASRPLFDSTTPIVRDQLRPFTRRVRPLARVLRPATRDLAAAVPSTSRSLGVLNRFFGQLAYDPPGADDSTLFWGAWLAHIGASLTSLQDANGAVGRALVLATCPQLDATEQIRRGNPELGPILALLNLADRLAVCPNSVP